MVEERFYHDVLRTPPTGTLQPDYVDGQATHKPQKSKKHFQLGSLSASTAENDNPIAPSAIASVAQNNPRPR